MTPAMQESINPRHLREKYQEWVGKKVVVGLSTYHYLCGTWKLTEGRDAVFRIGDREKRVALQEIETVAAATAAQAEFFK
jgi:hypothetical protein